MKYLSLFSGIGGFEVALHSIFPHSQCLGFSEIKPEAITVYQHHFPTHKNIGDITLLTENTIQDLVKNGCDIVFGGFPCKNLSSLASIKGGNSGLDGNQSKLFFDMMRIIHTINLHLGKQVYVIFENNASMSTKNKTLITNFIKQNYPNIILTTLDGSQFGVQSRKRLFWTNFPLNKTHITCSQSWNDILDNSPHPNISDNYVNCLNKFIKTKSNNKHIIQAIELPNNTFQFSTLTPPNKHFKSRWQMSFHSDTGTHNLPYTYPIGKSRPITASFGNHNILVDRTNNDNSFTLRMFTSIEIERLFGLPDNYTSIISSKNKRKELLGNSVIVLVLQYIFQQLKLNLSTTTH
jgi:DNA-cytosine methyltransferase